MIKSSFETKRSLGQNFLKNEKIYRFMLEEISPEKEETIIEIGPGEGILTEYLAQSGAQILAIEKDHRLIPILKAKFKDKKNVIILEEDILKFEPENHLSPKNPTEVKSANFKLIGNIPYYLTSHLLRIVLENWPKPKLILFMVQKEVAQRIIAKPPKMNLLGLAVQFYAEVKVVKNVSRKNFHPTPKVDSSVIKIVPKEQNIYSKEFQRNFFQLAHAAFGQKRKQILNSLVHNLKLNKSFITSKLAEVPIEPNRRPESLTLEEWEKLTQVFWPEL